MLHRGLKSNIAVNLALLILLAMVLTDFVVLITVQKDMVRAEMEKCDLFFSFAAETLPENESAAYAFSQRLDRLLSRLDFSYALVVDANGRPIYNADRSFSMAGKAQSLAGQSRGRQSPLYLFQGLTWGTFWPQSRYLLAASPIARPGKSSFFHAAVVSDLRNVYRSVRHKQKLLFFYLIINTALLTVIGLSRLTRVYLRPLQRLALRAEEYRDETGLYFTARKEDNELVQLSKALNRMLLRISDDRERLRSTIIQLEHTNSELRKAQSDIIRAEKLASVGRLSSGIAHEIGNPIGIVMGYLDLLKDESIPEGERKEYISRTESEIKRIHSIIRRLLDFSRSTGSGSDAVSVHQVITDISSLWKYQQKSSEIDLELVLGAGEDCVVGDADELKQVFLNLLLNASDAIFASERQPGGKIRICTENIHENEFAGKKGRLLKIDVRDNGNGISGEDIGNVFDPFFTTKDPGEGTGLGLWVSFMIVESMGGRITVSSKAGIETCITILLPLRDISNEH